MHRHVNPSVIGWLGLIAAMGSLVGSPLAALQNAQFFLRAFAESFQPSRYCKLLHVRDVINKNHPFKWSISC